ncbi:MAG: class I SAM-dependent methyltransferase [Solirubrobacterales bacterium]
MLHRNRQRAESFGADADRYDRARPSYPKALVEELLGDGAVRVLDVGCGTGIVSRLFQARGAQVLGIEPDRRMASLARRRGVSVELATFESWNARERRFDLLTCGQAWHWVDPDVGALKAADVLHRGGRLGLFWNFGRFPRNVREALAAVYGRLEPELERYSVLLGNADRRLDAASEALGRTGCFTPPELLTWDWTRRYTTEQWLESLLTHSDHHALPAPRRDALIGAVGEAIDRLGGAFEMTYESHLVTSRTR